MLLFLCHLRFGLRRLVALTREMQDAVNQNTVQLLFEGDTYHFRVRANGIEGDEDIAVERLSR